MQIALVLLLAACSPGGSRPEEVAAFKLTHGIWAFNGVARQFNPDGTWVSVANNNVGTWEIKNGALTAYFAGSNWAVTFPLPLNPGGTPGADIHGKYLLLTQQGVPPNSPKPASQESGDGPVPNDLQGR